MISFTARLLAAVIALAALGGCIAPTAYVDPTLPQAGKSDVAAISSPAPVQLLFEFQTKGVPNPKVTQLMRPKVQDVVQRSALFSDVALAPTANEHKLFITVNNIVITPDAAAKGFGTGLTFGLVGTMVTDGYLCEATYLAPGQPEAKFNYQHAIHSTIGNKAGPPGLAPHKLNEAADIVVEQLTWSILRDLSKSGRIP